MDPPKFDVTGLEEGEEYLFRVTAINDEGESEPLVADAAIKAKNPFGNFLLFAATKTKTNTIILMHGFTGFLARVRIFEIGKQKLLQMLFLRGSHLSLSIDRLYNWHFSITKHDIDI